jgi:hypothetical protein
VAQLVAYGSLQQTAAIFEWDAASTPHFIDAFQLKPGNDLGGLG